jgi:hypothetical protein
VVSFPNHQRVTGSRFFDVFRRGSLPFPIRVIRAIHVFPHLLIFFIIIIIISSTASLIRDTYLMIA